MKKEIAKEKMEIAKEKMEIERMKKALIKKEKELYLREEEAKRKKQILKEGLEENSHIEEKISINKFGTGQNNSTEFGNEEKVEKNGENKDMTKIKVENNNSNNKDEQNNEEPTKSKMITENDN